MLTINILGDGTATVTDADGQPINSADMVAAGATVRVSIVPAGGHIPTARINGSTSVALVSSGGTYSGSFHMPGSASTLEIQTGTSGDYDPNDDDGLDKD